MSLWVTGTIRKRCLALIVQFTSPQPAEMPHNSDIMHHDSSQYTTVHVFPVLAGTTEFLSDQNVQTASGFYQASHSMRTGVLSRK